LYFVQLQYTAVDQERARQQIEMYVEIANSCANGVRVDDEGQLKPVSPDDLLMFCVALVKEYNIFAAVDLWETVEDFYVVWKREQLALNAVVADVLVNADTALGLTGPDDCLTQLRRLNFFLELDSPADVLRELFTIAARNRTSLIQIIDDALETLSQMRHDYLVQFRVSVTRLQREAGWTHAGAVEAIALYTERYMAYMENIVRRVRHAAAVYDLPPMIV